MGKIPLLALCIFIAAVAAAAGYFLSIRSGTYSECMLQKGKGVPTEMLEHVSGVCERRYPFEKEIPGSIWPQFRFQHTKLSGQPAIVVAENRSEYRITRIVGVASFGDCDSGRKPKSSDRMIVWNFDRAGKIGSPETKVPDEIVKQLECYFTDALYGVRDNSP